MKGGNLALLATAQGGRYDRLSVVVPSICRDSQEKNLSHGSDKAKCFDCGLDAPGGKEIEIKVSYGICVAVRCKCMVDKEEKCQRIRTGL